MNMTDQRQLAITALPALAVLAPLLAYMFLTPMRLGDLTIQFRKPLLFLL
jgi:hypothetical protein